MRNSKANMLGGRSPRSPCWYPRLSNSTPPPNVSPMRPTFSLAPAGDRSLRRQHHPGARIHALGGARIAGMLRDLADELAAFDSAETVEERINTSAAIIACHHSVRVGSRAEAGRDECAFARDGTHAQFRPVQSRPPTCIGAEAEQHRVAVRPAVISDYRACPGRSAARSDALQTRDPGFCEPTGVPDQRCTAARCTASGTRVERRNAFSRRIVCCIDRRHPRRGARLAADAAGDHDRAVRGRRTGRRARPRAGAAAVRAARPAGGDRGKHRHVSASGGGGVDGSSRVARGAPDGHILVLGSISTHTFNQTLFKQPQYNVLTDFTPVALIRAPETPPLVLVAAQGPAAEGLEFAALAEEPATSSATAQPASARPIT